MIDRDELTARLKSEVTTLVDDLRTRSDEVDEVGDVVREQWSAAVAAERTAHDMETWREGLLTQVAVSWVLGCVFIRFCEDNRLVTAPMISGRDEWRRWARDNQVAYFREHPEHAERDYLLFVFGQAAALPGLSDVFGEHNPLWQFGPSADAARDLIDLWRTTDPETGELLWDFADPSWSTRFLGDLYQDLSEHAKKTYALLQTPDFVETFILDRTLDPAIDEFGLTGPGGTGFRMIDPACGSGHFLLGAFDRLATRWLAKEPAAGARSAVAKALDSVFGVDLNPFAASIARFRLLVAALRFADVKTLAEAPNLNIHVAVGDSLLHGTPEGQLANVGIEAGAGSIATRHLYETEDAETVTRYLDQRYHAVVANPPYITPKDPAANTAYRKLYDTCHRQYALSVPFMERLFQLAERGTSERPPGFVGQITSNSFMKREFGKKMVEEYIASDVDLTHVIDTSGFDVAGHGTPTMILFGRNRLPISDEVRAVLGIRGEPTPPKVPAEGVVWRSIEQFVDQPGKENEYISSAVVPRSTLGAHPWSLQGGAAAPTKRRIDAAGSTRLSEHVKTIGRVAHTSADEAYFGPTGNWSRHGLADASTMQIVEGDIVRDYRCTPVTESIFPYDQNLVATDADRSAMNVLWTTMPYLKQRREPNGTHEEIGLTWYEWSRFHPERFVVPLGIAFAFVASHNHFVLDRGGKVFKQSAPVIKLSADATEEDHLQLLGLLNSSVACFWMQQVFHNKGGPGGGSSKDEKWHDFYEFDGTKLKQFPIGTAHVLAWARALDDRARELSSITPASISATQVPTADVLEESRERSAELRAEMVWLQEELDWRCMFVYGITDTDLACSPEQVFELARGERSFEIALAQRVEQKSAATKWFAKFGIEALIDSPSHWPDWYVERTRARLELIESDKSVNLLERPEYKRRWNWESWDDLANDALQRWLLSRLEDDRYWPNTEPKSIAQLADMARSDVDFVQVAQLYRDSVDVDLVDLIGDLAKSDAVPFLATWRYRDSGMRKRSAWERTWDLQRQEDAGVDVGKIPVPPKYGTGDFRSSVSWKLRGKLDVPKERFVVYSGLERDNDSTAVIGWAGWDHLQQAQALAALYQQRRDTDGWPTERLVPILAGLHELVPWLRQWHNDVDPDIGQGLGDYYADYLAAEMQRHGLGADDLTAWRPPVTQRGRKKAAKKADT